MHSEKGRRSGSTQGLSDFLALERRRLFDDVAEARRGQLRAAERQREVFRAWNEVCARTREGQHVTGLKYLPETNELLVYVETGSWATELAMMREVIRARMAVKGVEVADLVFKATRAGYVPLRVRDDGSQGASTLPGARPRARAASASPAGSSPIRPSLTVAESSALDAAVAPIEDPKLKEALRKAMGASFEWNKSGRVTKEP